MGTSKALQANFEDLFESKEEAVICYLSLERRYMALKKRYDDSIKPKCKVCGLLLSDCRAGHSQA